MADSYEEFIARKSLHCKPQGLTYTGIINAAMSDDHAFQADVLKWSLRLGRSAAFIGTGLGKTLLELEWSRIVADHTDKPVLILAPLAVADQTSCDEAPKFGFTAPYCASMLDVRPGINITNYERLDKFDPSVFGGVVLDESSILKAFDGSTRTALIESFADTPFRLAATATPAPNDYTELGPFSHR